MQAEYWHKQTSDKPLFPDLLWAKPVNKQHAGKLAIIGGNLHGFSAPATAFSEAEKAGAGTLTVVLPSSIQKIVGGFLPEAVFVASTPIGSFGHQSLAELLDTADWADAVLLAGDFGKNSETTIVIEKFLEKYKGQLTVVQDGIDLFSQSAAYLLERPDTTLIVTFAQLQKLATGAKFTASFISDMGLVRLVDLMHKFSLLFAANIVVEYENTFVVAASGQISTTQASGKATSLVNTSAHTSVWWLQHPGNTFESLTAAVLPSK